MARARVAAAAYMPSFSAAWLLSQGGIIKSLSTHMLSVLVETWHQSWHYWTVAG